MLKYHYPPIIQIFVLFDLEAMRKLELLPSHFITLHSSGIFNLSTDGFNDLTDCKSICSESSYNRFKQFVFVSDFRCLTRKAKIKKKNQKELFKFHLTAASKARPGAKQVHVHRTTAHLPTITHTPLTNLLSQGKTE